MSGNPYDSPALEGDTLNEWTVRQRIPIGVRVVSAVVAFWGLFVLACVPINLAMKGAPWLFWFLRNQGIPSIVLWLGVLGAIGMWHRARWGWGLAIFYCMTQIYPTFLRLARHPATIGPVRIIEVLIYSAAIACLLLLSARSFFGLSLKRAVVLAVCLSVIAVLEVHVNAWLTVVVRRM